jgi:CubicO group peptidase (beta-lactamase class C family)
LRARERRDAMLTTDLEMTADRVREILVSAIEDGVFPAAQAAFGYLDGALVQVSAGRTPKDAVSDETSFDIASLTKVFTASACLRLMAAGVLRLEDPLGRWLPGSASRGLSAATLEQLLAHEAGLAAWQPFFTNVPEDLRGTPGAGDTIVELVLESPLDLPPGTRATYSDLGFILLGRVVEEASGLTLEEIIYREVCRPLGLCGVRFRPLGRATPDPSEFAPTEACPWRGRVLVGEVHDDNAWAMGGVSGHAGLFASASDIAKLGLAWLAALHGRGWLPRDLASRAVTRRPLGRGLGWDLKSPEGSSCGTRLSADAFGHLGFTGGSLWCDPERRLAIALLTNRVHFGRDNQKIRSFRPVFHDVVLEVLEKGG